MKQDIALKLVAALRSRQYKQGKDTLRSPINTFCCLGVLCNIHAQEHPEFAATQTDPTVYDGHRSRLSPDVMRWAGMRDSLGETARGRGLTSGSRRFRSLASANDAGVPFTVIADYIEANWRTL